MPGRGTRGRRGVVNKELFIVAVGRRPLDTRLTGTYALTVFPRRKVASRQPLYGAVAQLGERGVRNAEVGSSILLRSTHLLKRSSFLLDAGTPSKAPGGNPG